MSLYQIGAARGHPRQENLGETAMIPEVDNRLPAGRIARAPSEVAGRNYFRVAVQADLETSVDTPVRAAIESRQQVV